MTDKEKKRPGMILFGRRIKAQVIPSKLVELFQMFLLSLRFKKPLTYWFCYLKRRPPKGNMCELRSGIRIFLSSNPHDIVTVMVNFCRREYGVIEPASTVVDIGANIGTFTLLAIQSGAARVLAFEPNSEAFEALTKNLTENQLCDNVRAYHNAVSSESGRPVFIASGSSPYNKILNDGGSAGDVEEVQTISLNEALADCDHVDLMKLDCEGAEYEIILDSDASVFEKIKRIRMELHPSKAHSREEVVQHLKSVGYTLVKRYGLIFWFER